MKKVLKSKKGITLVALVITIIVLLILAGVSLNLLIGEKGLVNRAKNAVAQYDKSAEDERKGLDDLANQIDKLVDGTVVPDILKKYILGEDGTGRSVLEILNPVTMKFIGDEIIPDAEEKLILAQNAEISDENLSTIIAYENNIYIVKFKDTSSLYDTEDVLDVPSSSLVLNSISEICTENVDIGFFNFNGQICFHALGIKNKLNPTHSYAVLVENEDFQGLALAKTSDLFLGPLMLDGSYGIIQMGNIVGIMNENWIFPLDNSGSEAFSEGIAIKVYDIGQRSDMVVEGEFIAWLDPDDQKWAIVATPAGTVEVPETIKGKKIEKIIVSNIADASTKTLVIRNTYELVDLDSAFGLNGIVLKVSDTNKVQEWLDGFSFISSINFLDLSECGDDYILNDNVLEFQDTKIYVSSNVKTRYQSYDNVIAK